MGNCKILIVDDSTENLHVLYLLLSGKFNLYCAKSGREALELARKVQPQLILLDVMMPDMDGFEVCRELKRSELLRDIPVIFITASIETANEELGFELGAVDYITKPFRPSIVQKRIETHLKIKLQKDELERAALKVRELSGLLPMCSWCKKIRDDKGYWSQVESFLARHSDIMFTHGICPACNDRLLYELDGDQNTVPASGSGSNQDRVMPSLTGTQ